MNKLKRPVFLLLTTGLLCATGTAAYFSDFEKKINSAAVGYVTTEIEEDFPDPTPTPMENGPSYRKEIRIGNFSGSVKGFQADCYVRMSLSYSNDDIGRGVKLTGLDTANWVYNSQDGYYYYRKKYPRVKKQLLCVPDFRSIPKRSMILIGTALRILRSMFMRKLYRQKDFQIMKVRGGIFQIRFLLRQKGGGMLEKTP